MKKRKVEKEFSKLTKTQQEKILSFLGVLNNVKGSGNRKQTTKKD